MNTMNCLLSISSRLPGKLSAILIATLVLPLATSFGQVKIEAKSSSSLDVDGNNGASAPVNSPPASLNSGFSGKSSVSRVNVPTPNSGTAKVTTRDTPVVTRTQPGQPLAATQRVESNQPRLDPKKMKRMAELRRELNISDAATKARLAMPADDLFLPEENTKINSLSEPTLRKIAEYLTLSDKKNVTVKGYYVAGESTKELSWARSLSLIEWMSKNSELGLENFKAAGPQPETQATVKKNSNELADTEFINRIELHLE